MEQAAAQELNVLSAVRDEVRKTLFYIGGKRCHTASMTRIQHEQKN